MARLIGILGGTFDPVHFGHLRPVYQLAQQLELFKTHYVLSARPPHKEIPEASIEHRYNMLTLALDAYPQFIADDQEMQRPGPSFTVWTIRNMRQRYQHDSLCLIVGMDAYLDMHNWYRWYDIVTLANIVVLARPGWKPDRRADAASIKDLSGSSGGVVHYANTQELSVSASEVRTRLRKGEDVSDAVPAEVLAYIKTNQIYEIKECHE